MPGGAQAGKPAATYSEGDLRRLDIGCTAIIVGEDYRRMNCVRLALISFVGLAAIARGVPGAATRPDSARDIQPLLKAHCIQCHGPDKSLGGLRLDSRALALKGGVSGVLLDPAGRVCRRPRQAGSRTVARPYALRAGRLSAGRAAADRHHAGRAGSRGPSRRRAIRQASRR